MKWRDPDEARGRLFEAARAQAGYFSSRQAAEAGYSRRLQHYHVQRGHWHRIERGIYRLREFPPTPHEDLVRWTLWSGGRAVISHEMAAAVHELGDLLPSRVHLTVPPGFRKKVPASVVVHRSSLDDKDTVDMIGFRVTSPLRTILDLFVWDTESDRLAAAVRDAIERGAVRRRALEAEISKLDERCRERGRRVLVLARRAARAI